MTPIFYRHWLELRRNLVVACALALVAAVGYGFAVEGAAGYFAKTGHLTQEIARYEALRAMIAAPHLVPWAIHTLIVGFFSLFFAGIFHGTGLEAGASPTSVRLNHPSRYFTASLPLSRDYLIGSRLAATVGSLATVLALSLVAHCLVLLIIGEPIPFLAMARTSLLGIAIGLGPIAVGTFVGVTSEVGAPLTMFAVTMGLWLTQRGWNAILLVISGTSFVGAAAVIAASLLLVTLGLLVARRKEI